MHDTCANCGAVLSGPYCSCCGQKRFADADRRLGHLLRQFFAAATDLDGRFWGSLLALHLLAFNMAAIQILIHGMDVVRFFLGPADWHTSLLNWTERAVMALYIVVALRRVYDAAWRWAAAATAGLLLAYVLTNVYLYRPVLILTAFALT